MPAPLTFREVQDLRTDLGFDDTPIAQFGSLINQAVDQDLASSAIDSGFSLGVKRASAGLDRLLETTGIPEASEESGREKE